MKKMNKILLVIMVVFLGACSSINIDTSGYKITTETLKEPYKVMDKILIKESILSDWYNNEEPVHYLTTRQIIKKNGKDEIFLNSLKTKEITNKDIKKFKKLTEKYLNKLERKYKLKDENIKDTKELVKKLVIGYNFVYPTISKHLMTVVATEKEKNYILELNKKSEDEITDKDRTKVRKLLNKWLERKEFFDGESIYNTEISKNTVKLVELSKKKDLTSVELNNLNSKTMEIAFPELISSLSRWGK
ncbi:MAG: hypothetical protein B6227_01810 [Fusobacteriia bacterium 4572_74]|nr:MAG: hypothetical protein B6227_01810 [Fusobacteriia bacterium 4572_74]